MSLDQEYEHLIQPHIFITHFSNEESFRHWLRKGCINDLRDTLKAFEREQLFEYCNIIQSEIDRKVDVMLSGFGFD